MNNTTVTFPFALVIYEGPNRLFRMDYCNYLNYARFSKN